MFVERVVRALGITEGDEGLPSARQRNCERFVQEADRAAHRQGITILQWQQNTCGIPIVTLSSGYQGTVGVARRDIASFLRDLSPNL